MDVLNWVRNQWDRVGAWVLVALGALALVLGWVGVTGTPFTFEQIPYVISGGLGGLFLLGVGAMLWISADLRDEWRKLDQLLELYEERHRVDGESAPDDRGSRSDVVQSDVGKDDTNVAAVEPESNGSPPLRRRRSNPVGSSRT